MPSKPTQPNHGGQDDITVEPTESQYGGEITCKGYGPVHPIEDQEEGE